MKPGDIILISHPYTDFTSIKVRPALVISSEEYNQRQVDVIFIPISSSIQKIAQEDIIVESNSSNFPNTGLKKSSIMKCGKIFTAERKLTKRYLGYLSINTLNQIRKKLQVLFSIS